MIVIGIAITACLGFIVILCLALSKLGFAGGSLPVTAEWIDELSIDRYRPMMRLLDHSDIDFLRSQPGFSPDMATRLRVQRCQIFRGYLRCLNSDFKRVCSAINMLMLQSTHDRPDLASILVHSRITFACGLLNVNVRVFFYRWGLGDVDVTSLVKTFDSMRLELRRMVPAADPMGA
jgi:hypothetical protein